MNQKKMAAAFWNVINSDAFEQRIGGILQKIVDAKLDVEMTLERHDKELGRGVVETKKINVLDFLASSQPAIQGAIRGCQKDSAEARNRAAETRNMLAGLLSMLPQAGRVIDTTPRPPQLDGTGQAPPASHINEQTAESLDGGAP